MKQIILIVLFIALSKASTKICSCGEDQGYHFDIDTETCATLKEGDEGFISNCFQHKKHTTLKTITCEICKPDFILKSGACQPHTLGKCLLAKHQYGSDKCITCELGQILDFSDYSCVPPTAEEDITGCAYAYKTAGLLKCDKCSKGYYLKDDQCESFSAQSAVTEVSNCKKSKFEETTINCTECDDNFYLNNVGQVCISYSDTKTTDPYFVQNCLSYNQDFRRDPQCMECKDGFYMSTDSESGKKFCNPNPTSEDVSNYREHCSKYFDGQFGVQCSRCGDGHYINDTRACRPATSIVENCGSYRYNSEAQSTSCISCKDEYFSKDEQLTWCPVVVLPEPETPLEPAPEDQPTTSAHLITFSLIILILSLITLYI